MRVIIDPARCQGHGRCYDLAPDVFEPDDRGHATAAVTGELPGFLEADTRLGAGNCPERAIRLVGDVPGQSTASSTA